MNEIIKILLKIIIILFIIQISFTLSNKVDAISFDEIFQSGDDFLNTGKDGLEGNLKDDKGEAIAPTIDMQKLNISIQNISGFVRALGVALAVIIGAMIGIKIMWGSTEEQAKAKEALIPYILGCVVIFGAYAIWRIIITVIA